MELNRRKYGSLVTGTGIVGLAGCVNIPGDDGGQQQETSENESNPDENEGDDEESEGEESEGEESEDEDQSEDVDFGDFHQDLMALLEFTEWKVDEFSSSLNEFISGLNRVQEELENLLEKDMSSITQSDLDNLFELAEESTEIDEKLDEYYGHRNLSAAARALENDLQTNFDRSEHEALREEMENHQVTYQFLSSGRYYEDVLTSNPVFGNPYRFFVAGDEPSPNDFVFDVVFEPNADGGLGEAFFVLPDEVSILNYPFNIDDEGEIDTLRNREFEVVEYASDDIDKEGYDIETELYLSVTRQSLYDNNYPDNSSPIQLDSENVCVVLQKAESVEAAEDLYNGYIEAGTVDDEVELLGEEWAQVFFSDESPTVYTHILQVGELVILLDVIDEQWENRRFGDDGFELEEYLDSTVFDR